MQVNGALQICQKFGDTYFYATNYDTSKKIPLYSAYTLSIETPFGNRVEDWYIEPQLFNSKGDSNMIDIYSIKQEDMVKYEHNQAVNNDYKVIAGVDYNRGHLNPQMFHTGSQNDRIATNTLTNIAPQNIHFNNIIWNKLEEIVLKNSKTYCTFPGSKRYLITGVIPSDNPPILLNNRVNIPSDYWTAICCDSSSAIGNKRTFGWSLGFIASNKADTSIAIRNISELVTKLGTSLFTDYKDHNNNKIENCLFNKTKADMIRTEILKNPMVNKQTIFHIG